MVCLDDDQSCQLRMEQKLQSEDLVMAEKSNGFSDARTLGGFPAMARMVAGNSAKTISGMTKYQTLNLSTTCSAVEGQLLHSRQN